MSSLAVLVSLLGRLYLFVLLARVLISWVQVDPYHPLVQVLFQITEPVLRPIRQLIPVDAGFDFSPVIAMLLVQVITGLLVSVLT